MTWDPQTSCGFESRKIRHLVVPYLQGRSLDLGCGMETVWPRVIGIDNSGTFGEQNTQFTIQSDIADLSMFQDESCDGVFSSHALEDFEPAKIPGVLKEWSRVLKVGGFLCLYVPSANFYPKMGEPGANPAHRVDIYAGDIERWLCAGTTCGWTQVECEERGGGAEYSWFEVYQKRDDGVYERRVWERNPGGRRRALVCRFGAIGDQIMASSILPGLQEQGYHVTYMCMPQSKEVVLHDPNIDEFWVQERDFVPNVGLGDYWKALRERFDRFINLSESIEGALLQLPGRLTHDYPDESRRALYGHVNYWERTHDIAAVPHNFALRFYPTEDEHKWASAVRKQMDGPVVAWAVAGSSLHKIYPFVYIVVRWLLDQTNAHVVLLGDNKEGAALQAAIVACQDDRPGVKDRLHAMCGMWEIRKVLTFVQHADVVVGPETGVLNSVCMEDVPKVIYLSHSSPDNLTKHWKNTEVVTPQNTPCWPCHRLHYDTTWCPRDETTQAAACASSILPERVFAAIAAAVGAKREAA